MTTLCLTPLMISNQNVRYRKPPICCRDTICISEHRFTNRGQDCRLVTEIPAPLSGWSTTGFIFTSVRQTCGRTHFRIPHTMIFAMRPAGRNVTPCRSMRGRLPCVLTARCLTICTKRHIMRGWLLPMHMRGCMRIRRLGRSIPVSLRPPRHIRPLCICV